MSDQIRSSIAIKDTVSFARKLCPDDIEWSHAKMAGRSSIDFLFQMQLSLAINSGATTINIPDTVGYTFTYAEFGEIISKIKEQCT